VIGDVSHSQGPGLAPPPTESEELWAALAYLGAIFLGPFVPLGVFLRMRHRSAFLRRHAVQALNIALTCLLYAVSGAIVGALLAFANPNDALLIMSLVAAAGWLVMLDHLARGAAAAKRGEYRQAPSWLCTPLVK
jgi:uncharacterized protein